MTYLEAKSELLLITPNPFEYNERIRLTIIVPKLEKDFIKFLSDLKERKTTLNGVISYSTNSAYKLWSGDIEFYNITFN